MVDDGIVWPTRYQSQLEKKMNSPTPGRWQLWCRRKKLDGGHVCALYKDHYGNHKTKHFDQEWTDEECEDNAPA